MQKSFPRIFAEKRRESKDIQPPPPLSLFIMNTGYSASISPSAHTPACLSQNQPISNTGLYMYNTLYIQIYTQYDTMYTHTKYFCIVSYCVIYSV